MSYARSLEHQQASHHFARRAALAIREQSDSISQDDDQHPGSFRHLPKQLRGDAEACVELLGKGVVDRCIATTMA